ncbi:MAG: hypothetical protein IPH82_02670 [Chloroflexi bacterium]|nr:hypothetical protein [Chloroflexota bacterium]
MTASDLIIGHLPPTNPANPPTARVNISTMARSLAGAQTIVGQAERGTCLLATADLTVARHCLAWFTGHGRCWRPKALLEYHQS